MKKGYHSADEAANYSTDAGSERLSPEAAGGDGPGYNGSSGSDSSDSSYHLEEEIRKWNESMSFNMELFLSTMKVMGVFIVSMLALYLFEDQLLEIDGVVESWVRDNVRLLLGYEVEAMTEVPKMIVEPRHPDKQVIMMQLMHDKMLCAEEYI